jgi:hypothetical protein
VDPNGTIDENDEQEERNDFRGDPELSF